MAKKESKAEKVERVYNVPLRKEFLKVQRWRRTKRAVTALRNFLKKHMKTEVVKISKEINDKLWQHGIKNPPHHIKVTVTKNEKGEAIAELFGFKKKEEKKENKKEQKAEIKEAPEAEVKKEAPKTEDYKKQ